MININSIIGVCKDFENLFAEKTTTERHFQRSYCCTIVWWLASRNSNGSSSSIDRQLFELFVYEKLLSEFQLGRPCGSSIDISLIRAVSRKIVRRSLQGSHNPRLSWQRTRTKKETSLEAIGQEKYKVTLFTYWLGWVISDERFC